VRRAALALGLAALFGSAATAQELALTQVERGRYLTAAGNCISCHTDFENEGPPFGGGRELETPFGVIISPNITFDAETGIGNWSRDDFWRALHEGVRRDGAPLYPAMPYVYFTRMPREDVDAIYDYLSTVPPVTSDIVPEEELPAVLQIRAAVRGWNLLHFDQGVFEPDPTRSAEWNRGAYLVTGPGHCGGCHTSKNLLGGDEAGAFLNGGVLENWHAPNVRGGQNGGIAHWSEVDIVEFLKTGRTSHTIAMQRMGEVIEYSTQHLTTDDLEAIATFLQTLVDFPPEPPADEPDEASLIAGAAIYFDNCAACHRSDGSGVPYIFAALDGSNKVRSDDPTTVLRIILEGAKAIATDARPTQFGMPAFNWKLTDQEIADLVTYLRTAWSNRAGPVSASEVADLRETLAE
jgi:mono/diheme cytochrome c family protein